MSGFEAQETCACDFFFSVLVLYSRLFLEYTLLHTPCFKSYLFVCLKLNNSSSVKLLILHIWKENTSSYNALATGAVLP